MAPKNPNSTELRDGRWYSIIGKYPRLAHEAKWDATAGQFSWEGTSETKTIPLDEVDEILCELDPPAGAGPR
ncbi:hypothetical protein [Mycolicibacterium sp.]|uniref:hypothetical protein n=1 Tax=Mycolicibacterium sp. TaxID=2320850 RepID=UPI00355CA9C1